MQQPPLCSHCKNSNSSSPNSSNRLYFGLHPQPWQIGRASRKTTKCTCSKSQSSSKLLQKPNQLSPTKSLSTNQISSNQSSVKSLKNSFIPVSKRHSNSLLKSTSFEVSYSVNDKVQYKLKISDPINTLGNSFDIHVDIKQASKLTPNSHARSSTLSVDDSFVSNDNSLLTLENDDAVSLDEYPATRSQGLDCGSDLEDSVGECRDIESEEIDSSEIRECSANSNPVDNISNSNERFEGCNDFLVSKFDQDIPAKTVNENSIVEAIVVGDSENFSGVAETTIVDSGTSIIVDDGEIAETDTLPVNADVTVEKDVFDSENIPEIVLNSKSSEFTLSLDEGDFTRNIEDDATSIYSSLSFTDSLSIALFGTASPGRRNFVINKRKSTRIDMSDFTFLHDLLSNNLVELENLSREIFGFRVDPEIKKKYLLIGRDIMLLGKKLASCWIMVARNCTDVILRDRLIKSLEKCDTSSSRMKVIILMKSKDLDDGDSEKVVLTAAIQVVNAAKDSLRDLEAAHLRIE